MIKIIFAKYLFLYWTNAYIWQKVNSTRISTVPNQSCGLKSDSCWCTEHSCSCAKTHRPTSSCSIPVVTPPTRPISHTAVVAEQLRDRSLKHWLRSNLRFRYTISWTCVIVSANHSQLPVDNVDRLIFTIEEEYLMPMMAITDNVLYIVNAAYFCVYVYSDYCVVHTYFIHE